MKSTSSFILILMLANHGVAASTAVLILARGGSKGIHLKNLQHIGGKSLLRNSIEIAQEAGFHDVTVSTDHPLIALEALRNNALVFHRSFSTATDWAPSIWGAAEFLSKRLDVETLVLLQTTSPFLKPKGLKQALKKLDSPIGYDCVFSITKSYKLRWNYVNNVLTAINFNIDKRPRRQDWDGELIETGAFYITRRPLIMIGGHFQNKKLSITDSFRWNSFIALPSGLYRSITGLKIDLHTDYDCYKLWLQMSIFPKLGD